MEKEFKLVGVVVAQILSFKNTEFTFVGNVLEKLLMN
jgi:hypothetical protein